MLRDTPGMSTTRRPLGTGPDDLTHVRATEADLHTTLPGIRLPDLVDLRARGVLDAAADDQEHDDPRGAGGPAPDRRRPLGHRE
jgi:hypothetical protein